MKLSGREAVGRDWVDSTQTGRWSERIHRREPVIQVLIGRPPVPTPLRWALDMALDLRHTAWDAAHVAELEARPWAAVFQHPAPAQVSDVDEPLTEASSAPLTGV